jgi:metal-responsive CopG/Arc/MetJ family transcriptional regulator
MPPERAPGRPKGEETCVISVRMPVDLRERLDRHLDRLVTKHGIKTSRVALISHAVQVYLEGHEEYLI